MKSTFNFYETVLDACNARFRQRWLSSVSLDAMPPEKTRRRSSLSGWAALFAALGLFEMYFARHAQINHGYLFLDTEQGRSLQVMHITAPILDGVIGFKHPGEAAVAEYLRRRFRVAEFKSSI